MSKKKKTLKGHNDRYNEDGFYRPPRYPLIYTIHGMSDLDVGSESNNFGWHETIERAKAVVLKDGEMLHEECYEYIVIEGYPPGTYRIPARDKEHWYRWNFKKQKYLPIDKPISVKHIVGFAL